MRGTDRQTGRQTERRNLQLVHLLSHTSLVDNSHATTTRDYGKIREVEEERERERVEAVPSSPPLNARNGEQILTG